MDDEAKLIWILAYMAAIVARQPRPEDIAADAIDRFNEAFHDED